MYCLWEKVAQKNVENSILGPCNGEGLIMSWDYIYRHWHKEKSERTKLKIQLKNQIIYSSRFQLTKNA